MKIKEIVLKNFKRFTDLTISNLPESARLVVMVGPNGCGKSSLFDALHVNSQIAAFRSWSSKPDYFFKTPLEENRPPNYNVSCVFHGNPVLSQNMWKKLIYARTAYRHEASFNTSQMSRVGDLLETSRQHRMIDVDAVVSNNYNRMVSNMIEDVFEREPGVTTIEEYRGKLIGEISGIMQDLFDNPPLVLTSLGKPLEAGTFRFAKGDINDFAYENLSGGEKAAFDLILDLTIKRRVFDDTVYCIDEPEIHMGTRLQANLLQVMYDLIPENCQLWIATHSIGMLRKAWELSKANSNVVFLDFSDKDFDQKQIIEPVPVIDSKFWRKLNNIALDDLAALTTPDTIIICEGKNKSFDAKCYQRIFGADGGRDVFFISGGDKSHVKKMWEFFHNVVLKNSERRIPLYFLVDSDDDGEARIREDRDKGLLVLEKRSLESYLLDDEVLAAFCAKHQQEGSLQEITRIRENKSAVNIKDAADGIRIYVKGNWRLEHPGSDWKEFFLEHIVPLITPDMEVYKKLENCIFSSIDNRSMNNENH